MSVREAAPARASAGTLLYYCQSLVGIGHLTCSLRIIEALLPHFDVDLVHGGLDGGVVPVLPGLRSLRLAPLLHDEDSGEFFNPEGTADVDTVWAARREAIARFLGPRYRAMVVEFYPFGRRRFKQEIGALRDAVHARSGPVPMFTSVREVLVPRPAATEQRMVDSVRKHIHTVFVRGDPAVVRLDETFSLAPQIADRLCYTGYISPPPVQGWPPRRAQVLVSQGGGDVGRELLRAAIGAAALMPALHFVLAAGARTPPSEIEALRASACSGNVEVVPFLSDFQQQLRASALSISMGGDNTLLDVLSARTPALAYPYQGNSEQGLRIRKFAAAGLLHELTPGDLQPERLQARIEQVLAAPPPSRQIAMDGARVTSERIRAVLAEDAVA